MNIIFLIEVILIWYCNRYSTCERERVHIKAKDLQEPLRQTLHSFIHFSQKQLSLVILGLVEVVELDSLSDIGYDRKPFHVKKGRNALMEVD
jgi:hypothetical protein